MKLSALLREGITLHPEQAHGLLAEILVPEEKVIATCAVGAAYEAWMNPQDWNAIGEIELDAMFYACDIDPNARYPYPEGCYEEPYSGPRSAEMLTVIVYLNDTKQWTREQIADWLASINL